MFPATLRIAIFSLSSACLLIAAQDASVGADPNAAEVRLELHNSQTTFMLGDPIRVDLVFTSRFSGYSVNTDPYAYRPAPDWLTVTPQEGWSLSHAAIRGQGYDGGQIVELHSDPVRVPVLLNRTIVFEKPGRYSVSVTTERLLRTATRMRSSGTDDCEDCRSTNAVSIELVGRPEQEENALVKVLSIELASPVTDLGYAKPSDSLLKQFQEQAKKLEAGKLDEKQQRDLVAKVHEAMLELQQSDDKQKEDRRERALRLAYLPGDEAMRAKVHLIVGAKDSGEAAPIEPLLVDGLPSSRNVELQFRLLQSAWLDPTVAPSHVLETALRQSRELLRGTVVTDESILWQGTAEHRQAILSEYSSDRSGLVASLRKRSGSNHVATAYFLMMGRPGLSRSEEEQVRAAVLADFSKMTYTMQSALREQRRDQLRDPAPAP